MRVGKWLGVATLFLLLSSFPAAASAHPRGFGGGFRFHTVRVFPAYDPFFWGYSAWGPGWYWDPWYYSPDVVTARNADYGTVEFRVKPESTKVYVDQHYLGTVDDLQGRHHETQLPKGYHNIKLVAPDGNTVQRSIYLAGGEKFKFEEKL
jgi:hypothetical protein